MRCMGAYPEVSTYLGHYGINTIIFYEDSKEFKIKVRKVVQKVYKQE